MQSGNSDFPHLDFPFLAMRPALCILAAGYSSVHHVIIFSQLILRHLSHWQRGPRRGSVTARWLGLWARIPPGAWMSFVSVVCCQVDVSSTS